MLKIQCSPPTHPRRRPATGRARRPLRAADDEIAGGFIVAGRVCPGRNDVVILMPAIELSSIKISLSNSRDDDDDDLRRRIRLTTVY